MSNIVDLSEFDWLPARIDFRDINCLAFATNMCDWATPENWITNDMIFNMKNEEDEQEKIRVYKEALSNMFNDLKCPARIIDNHTELEPDEDLAVLRFDIDDDLRSAEFHVVRQYKGRWVETCGSNRTVQDITDSFSIDDVQWEWDTNSLNDYSQSDNIYIAVSRHKSDPAFSISYPLEGYVYTIIEGSELELEGKICLQGFKGMAWFYSLDEAKDKSKDFTKPIILRCSPSTGKMKDFKGITTSEVYLKNYNYLICSRSKEDNDIHKVDFYDVILNGYKVQSKFNFIHVSEPIDETYSKISDYLNLNSICCNDPENFSISYCRQRFNNTPETLGNIGWAFGTDKNIPNKFKLEENKNIDLQVDQYLFDNLYDLHMDLSDHCKSSRHRQFLVHYYVDEDNNCTIYVNPITVGGRTVGTNIDPRSVLYSFSIYAIVDEEHERFLDILGLMTYNLPEYKTIQVYEMDEKINGFT